MELYQRREIEKIIKEELKKQKPQVKYGGILTYAVGLLLLVITLYGIVWFTTATLNLL